MLPSVYIYIYIIPARYPPSLNSVIAWILMVFISLSLWFTSHHYPHNIPIKWLKITIYAYPLFYPHPKCLWLLIICPKGAGFHPRPCQQSPAATSLVEDDGLWDVGVRGRGTHWWNRQGRSCPHETTPAPWPLRRTGDGVFGLWEIREVSNFFLPMTDPWCWYIW